MKKNRKIVSSALATGLALSTILVPTTGTLSVEAKSEKVSKEEKKESKQKEKLDKMREKTKKKNGKFKVSWDEEKDVPRLVSGKLSDANVDITTFLEESKDIFNIDDGEFDVNSVETDELGMSHYRTQLTVDGIPVYGAELLVHTDANGIVTAVNGQVEPKLGKKKWSKSVKLSQRDAIEVAESNLSFTPDANTYTTEPVSDLYVYEHENKWMPVYIVELQFLEPYFGREFFFIDAKKGDVLRSFNQLQHAEATGTGTGVLGDTKTINTFEQNGTYYLSDRTKASGRIETFDAGDQWATGSLVSDSDNNFNSSRHKAAVDAHYYAGVVYDYFKNEHNRNSYDDQGSDVISSVHVRDPDALNRPWNNAAWVGTQMVYGDGDGTTFTALSGSLDVVAHELTHAVTDFSADLVYEFEPGALNESFSDVFGIIVEADYEGSADWLLGEDVYTPNISGDALRSVSNPTQYNQPAHYDDFVVLPNTREGDWGGVHINSGIPNKAFYNIATTIGLDKSGDIYYRALTRYLTSQSQFIDARNALLQSAADLFGEDGTEYNAVADGFDAVGIGGDIIVDPDDTFEPNDSLSEAYSVTSGDRYTSYISSSTDEDFYTFTTGGAGEITVDLTNVPQDYDLFLLDENGSTLDKSENARTSDESITFSASGEDTFYVKVIGYNGANSSSPYSLTVSFPEEPTTEGEWYYEEASYDTPHPYSNNFTDTFTYQKAGAEQVAIHFSAFETEANYDFVHITDGNGATVASYDGTQDAFWVVVDGDEINATLDTDFSITAYGYTIDQVGYFSDTPLVQGVDQGEAKEAFYDEIEEADKPDPDAYVAPVREEKEEISEGEESGEDTGEESSEEVGNEEEEESSEEVGNEEEEESSEEVGNEEEEGKEEEEEEGAGEGEGEGTGGGN
ncbi:M4 family metallopeptidase [Cytobacillus sp. IB215665]|uniref:M4 family metallopeptidase n=1 Tax=Cytobacillus sp. IB215665 TaxID=3097357 RepID=UPI002A1063FD|nr:M4 family metallopeptidase [Cytobacillus sp. IB215665]MDX8363781.1 M4 family metallopeptidase [Cytobacillus sp. IB215665]